MTKRVSAFIFVFIATCVLISCAQAGTRVVMITNFGVIDCEMYDTQAPITVANFLGYVNSGFYDGILFHRIIEGFMIQHGVRWIDNFYIDYAEGIGDPIVNESDNGLSNVRGTLAMALPSVNDVPVADGATSQFFINQVDNLFLDDTGYGFGYCVFGEVVRGMDVVDTIAAVNTVVVSKNLQNFPWPVLAWTPEMHVHEPADLDYNGRVDLKDYSILAADWKQTDSNLSGDVILDGTVDENDLQTMNIAWMYAADWYRFCRSDIDRSGSVDFIDFTYMANEWTEQADSRLFGDLDYSDAVNQVDIAIFASDWLRKDE